MRGRKRRRQTLDGVRVVDVGAAKAIATPQSNSWRPAKPPAPLTSTAAGAPLKAETIAALTEVLPAQGVRTTADLRAAAGTADTLKTVERAWRATRGQRSGITWDYALTLAQIPGVKADRMVIKYLARAIGCRPGSVLSERAARLVSCVAETKGWNVIHLDHAIWRFESGRPFQDDDAATSSHDDRRLRLVAVRSEKRRE